MPRVYDRTAIRELKELGIEIDDLKEPDYKIYLLRGADVAGYLLTVKSIKSKSGLVTIETKIGYFLTG